MKILPMKACFMLFHKLSTRNPIKWLLLGSPMLVDPHPIQQHADLQQVVIRLHQEVTRPKARFNIAYLGQIKFCLFLRGSKNASKCGFTYPRLRVILFDGLCFSNERSRQENFFLNINRQNWLFCIFN